MRFLKILATALFLFIPTVFLSAQTTSLDQMWSYPDSIVLVAAHRGDWRNHPENSLSGIQSCIDKGIDIVEVDVRKTKDGKFVLMHDGSINRTTNGRGKVKDMTQKKLQGYFLKGQGGRITEERVPTLEEALDLAKGKIMLNLDKSAICMEELLPVIDSLDARQTVILKGSLSPGFFSQHIADNPEGPEYMAIKHYCTPEELETFLSKSKVTLVELILNNDTSHISRRSGLDIFQKHHCRLWYNALYKGIACGYGENRNARMTWDHFLERDAFIIQTDFPFELMQYLIDRGRHATPPEWETVGLSRLPDKEIDTAAMRHPEKTTYTNSKGAVYHTIKSGDTLWGLAKKYHTSVKAICALNANLTEKTILRIGRKIRIR